MRAALLGGVFVIGCGAATPVELIPPRGFVAREPTEHRRCEPVTRLCAGAELRVDWPGDRSPFDARVLVDGVGVDAGHATRGTCISSGTHVIELGSPSQGGAAREEIGIGADERIEVSLERVSDGSFALGVLRVGCEAVIGNECPLWSAAAPDLALLTVAALPERASRIRLGRVRVAVDGVLAIDENGAGTESGEPDPRIVSGWVSVGAHELDVELTYVPPRSIFGYSYAYRVHRAARIDVTASGAMVRIRSGDRGRVTQEIEEGLFLEIESVPP